jgi:hypothetical protein
MVSRYTVWFLAVTLLAGCGAAAKRSSVHAVQSEASYAGGGAAYGPMEAGAYSIAPAAPMKEMEMDYKKKDAFEDADGVILAAEKPMAGTPEPVPPAVTGGKTGEGGETPEGAMPDVVVEGRVIIYEARVGLAVFQVQEDLEKIRKQVKGWGGYMISMNYNTIVFRVPAETFDAVVDEVAAMGELISKDITGQDVTDEFNDLTIKLKNALAMRDRLVELLGKANTVKESLLIEAEMKRLLEEIELIKGKLKFLKESALYSKITVYLESKESYKKPIPKLPAPLQWIQYELGINALFEQ